VKTASEKTYTVSSGALNSTPTNQATQLALELSSTKLFVNYNSLKWPRLYHAHAVQELLLAYCWTPCCGTVITHCAYVVCYFRDVYPFIYFVIGMYVHHLGLYCILFRRFLISKINVALQLTKLWLKKVTTTTTYQGSTLKYMNRQLPHVAHYCWTFLLSCN